MNKALQFIIEIIRVFLILFIGLLILGYVEQKIIKLLGFTEFNWTLIFIADLLLIYIYYKNKLQFTGWFKSTHNKALSKSGTRFALGAAIFCFILGIVTNIIL
ncbi:hypothetical protein [Mesobacillus jeotgali]|uniref:hypothetical protein n=1 Tax=Mesobacillus jeotgali TaxID=129985 RepID=UPI0009A695B3|nr:hypothetical protein [Mesobacillus jeotgali]